jgi:hypothetical protein
VAAVSKDILNIKRRANAGQAGPVSRLSAVLRGNVIAVVAVSESVTRAVARLAWSEHMAIAVCQGKRGEEGVAEAGRDMAMTLSASASPAGPGSHLCVALRVNVTTVAAATENLLYASASPVGPASPPSAVLLDSVIAVGAVTENLLSVNANPAGRESHLCVARRANITAVGAAMKRKSLAAGPAGLANRPSVALQVRL